jgi:D-alanine-D-alanine ligase
MVTVIDTASGILDSAAEARLLVPSVGRAPPDPKHLEALAARERQLDILRCPELAAADVAFLVLHGLQGEGGELQHRLEHLGIAYTGSGPLGSMLAMDKDITKRLFRGAAIPTPDWAMWPATPAEIQRIGYPLIVKPSKAGSTVGLSLVRVADELPAAVEVALRVDDEVLLERYLPGRELTVGILGDEALAVGEIIPDHELFDYECKYTPGLTQEIFPADLPPALTARVRGLALAAHRALKLRDFSRVDFRLDERGEPSCIEVNTLPGLTRTSLLPQSAAAAGVGFGVLCERVATMALRRGGTRNKVKEGGELTS